MKQFKFDIEKLKHFKLSIAIYLASLMGIIIVIVAAAFILITLGNVKNLVGEYESEISKLKNRMIIVLAHTINNDIDRKDFKNVNGIFDIYKTENLLNYIYVEDNETGEIILGEKDYKNKEQLTTPDTKELSNNFSKYTFSYTFYF